MASCEESKANDFAHEAGVPKEVISERYTGWAHKYEEDLGPAFYKGPSICAETLAKLFPDVQKRKEINIMDIAAGTGFVGELLKDKGFENVDALEPSEGMVALAHKKGVYKRIYQEYLTTEPTLPKEHYDAAVSSGGMGEGHIPCSGLDAMIRLVKPGGFVVIVMREAYLQSVEEYKDRLEPRMKELTLAGSWEPVLRDTVPNYSFDNTGVVFVFKVKS